MSESSASKKSATDADTSLRFASKTLQDYEVISVIGNGTFGTCFKVRDRATGELYAWKGMDYDELSESQKQSLVSEISVLRQLQHPNIVQYYHHLVNHEAKSIFIVMECCEGGDLAQLITSARAQRKRFEERYVWRVLFQICRALQVCHNKIKQGTILHRDIKPANIFLDAQGNAKLGDFGLARMLRRNENFAKTFVGTPYYMSPEIVEGCAYGRKSDVWAVGCLVYEMCALRPPFSGREFEQLSANISNGKFRHIPAVYTSDLQEIVAFMLEVDKEQRPSIEIISRHPTVVRNISDLGSEFPQLVKAEDDFYGEFERDARCKLRYSVAAADLSSTVCTDEQNSFNEEYGQRRMSDVFTPDLRAELFYSVKRRILSKPSIRRSDPELYESLRLEHEHFVSVDDTLTPILPPAKPPAPLSNPVTEKSPAMLTENIFHQALQERLHAIRAQEFLLQQKEASLSARAQQLNDKEKRLQQLENTLHQKAMELEAKEKLMSAQLTAKKPTPPSITLHSKPPAAPPPPPIPPRKSSKHDDTYCSIDDTLLQQPTMAKMNLAALPATKALSTLRRVTFQSPKKFIKYDIENVPAAPTKNAAALKTNQTSASGGPMQASVSSRGSTDSAESTTHRRKSILSIFGLQRHKTASKAAPAAAVQAQVPASQLERLPFTARDDQVLAKCETSELGSIWTKEHKRAAFDLLAAMNAGQGGESTAAPLLHASKQHKFRQSARDRHHNLRRSHMRRSLIVASAPQVTGATGGVGGQNRDKILI